jgi:predicted membrane channel-forming protein YqfA (hemolysin III family)
MAAKNDVFGIGQAGVFTQCGANAFQPADNGRLNAGPARWQGAHTVYLVVVGWLYVVLMMAVAEATNTTGTVLGALVTFVLYGLVPIAIIVYVMRTPQRRAERKAREAAELAATQAASVSDPDAGGHAAGAAQDGGVAPVREKP